MHWQSCAVRLRGPAAQCLPYLPGGRVRAPRGVIAPDLGGILGPVQVVLKYGVHLLPVFRPLLHSLLVEAQTVGQMHEHPEQPVLAQGAALREVQYRLSEVRTLWIRRTPVVPASPGVEEAGEPQVAVMLAQHLQ